MKLGRLAIPTIAVIVVVLLGTLTVELVPTGPILASEPTSTHIPIELPELPDKSLPPTERSTQVTRSERAAALDQGTVQTWEDGDRSMRVLLQNDLVVQKTAANTPDDVVVVSGADSRPVFRSESGGGLMTLPGGVLLAPRSRLGRCPGRGFLLPQRHIDRQDF